MLVFGGRSGLFVEGRGRRFGGRLELAIPAPHLRHLFLDLCTSPKTEPWDLVGSSGSFLESLGACLGLWAAVGTVHHGANVAGRFADDGLPGGPCLGLCLLQGSIQRKSNHEDASVC